jgi:uncharacterized membrane protein
MITGQIMKKPETFSDWLFVISAVVGLVDALYLIWIKIANDKIYCLPGIGDCWTVNTSQYSQIFGIPISLFGAIAYLVILLIALSEKRSKFIKENQITLLFGITLAGFLYSLYLTYLELFVIHAICPFCVISAIMMTILFVLSVIRLVKSQTES